MQDRSRLLRICTTRAKRSIRLITGVLLAGTTSILLISACATPQLRVIPTVMTPVASADNTPASVAITPAALKVMTLNIAHSRSDGLHQILQSTRTAKKNLNAILEVIRGQDPDVVALQEADGPSFWSGNFSHVEYLARHHAFAQFVQSEHVRGPKLSYGTALLSDLNLQDPLTITFNPDLSPLRKGFLVSTIRWPGAPGIEVDMVSIHLDPFSASVRTKQAQKLIQTLRERNRPVILMGDFNTDWQAQQSALRMIADELHLKTYQPDNLNMKTFPALGKRLDWILVSSRFEYLSYEVLPDKVSDHLGVVALLGLNGQSIGSMQSFNQ